MNKAARYLFASLIVMVIACVGVILTSQKEEEHPVAKITSKGVLLQEVDLTGSGEKTFHISAGNGEGYNTVQVKNGEIWVSEASCPDQVCVNQGKISDGTVPIVCLPNQLIIEIVGGGGLDAAN